MKTDSQKRKIILTFDLEFWWNNPLLEPYLPKDKKTLIDCTVESIRPLLDLLKKHKIKATFFVLGELAQKHPDLIRDIFEAGHEIASHGYSHKNLWDLNEIEFEKEIKLTNQIIKDITGSTPKGFRAPSFSLNQKTKWALDILKDNGFFYDSSLFPLKTPFYGMNNVPLDIHRFSNGLIELPLAVYQLTKFRIPICGGFYFRVSPLSLYLYFLKLSAKKRTPVVYFHPRELHNFIPEVKGIPWLIKKIKFYGVNTSFERLNILLENFECVCINDYLLTHNLSKEL